MYSDTYYQEGDGYITDSKETWRNFFRVSTGHDTSTHHLICLLLPDTCVLTIFNGWASYRFTDLPNY